MRLFGYYVCHTFVNQLRKLFKTWVLIFLVVCMLFGGLIGFGAAMLDDAAGGDVTEDIETEILPEEEISLEEAIGISQFSLVELIAGGVILLVFVMQAMGADKNGSRIFVPADVNLLFASPMKPQSVLMFRTLTRLGTMVLASVYLLFQLPNLVINLGMDLWAALSLIAAWCLTLGVGTLLQVLLYTVCSTNGKLKQYLRKGIYLLLAAIGIAYLVFWKVSSNTPLNAAAAFFNSPASRFIPFWGWIKGFCLFAIEGNVAGALLCLGTTLAGGAGLCWVIWHVKADFYEDAMAKSEEMAEILQQAQAEKAGLVKRKKDRSERLRRDGIHRGSGANVFFHKAMYNRFRFAHLGIFTKTSETYLVAAVGMSLLCRFVFQVDSMLPVMLTLGVFVFFRAMGNPLAEDTGMDYFLLIPESTWRKLFWSLMGGTANCFLDLIPAALCAVLLGADPVSVLLWLPVVVSVDFFATTVGTFIGTSVPVSAGKTLKQVVQIMFIYFGRLPDIAIIAVALVFEAPALGALGCATVNLLLGLLFFALTPPFLEPGSGKNFVPEVSFTGDLKKVRKAFSKLGLGIFTILAAGTLAQSLAVALADRFWPMWTEHPWGMWVISFAPLYLVAVPLGLLLLRRVPVTPLPKSKLRPGKLAVITLICFFMMYAGNYLGILITALLRLLTGSEALNPVLDMTTGTSLLPRALVMVILAPVIEEYVFRKQLIDRMHVYGQKLAVITSALLFGLFHGNLSQFFYAAALGLAFGYVYVKTGKLRYSIGLHMLINFLGGVIAPTLVEKLAILENMENLTETGFVEALPGILALLLYAFTLLGMSIAGLVLLCVNRRKITFAPAALELPKGTRFKTAWCNAGMVLAVAGCLLMILSSFLVS